MTKKDFELIAQVLVLLGKNNAHCFDNDDDRHAIANTFAKALAGTNPRFDAEKFIKAATDI